MARILLPSGTLVGREFLILNGMLIQASQLANRLVAQIDQMTDDRKAASTLEASAEAQVPAGSGQQVCDALTAMKTALDQLAPVLAQFDQG